MSHRSAARPGSQGDATGTRVPAWSPRRGRRKEALYRVAECPASRCRKRSFDRPVRGRPRAARARNGSPGEAVRAGAVVVAAAAGSSPTRQDTAGATSPLCVRYPRSRNPTAPRSETRRDCPPQRTRHRAPRRRDPDSARISRSCARSRSSSTCSGPRCWR